MWWAQIKTGCFVLAGGVRGRCEIEDAMRIWLNEIERHCTIMEADGRSAITDDDLEIIYTP